MRLTSMKIPEPRRGAFGSGISRVKDRRLRVITLDFPWWRHLGLRWLSFSGDPLRVSCALQPLRLGTGHIGCRESGGGMLRWILAAILVLLGGAERSNRQRMP